VNALPGYIASNVSPDEFFALLADALDPPVASHLEGALEEEYRRGYNEAMREVEDGRELSGLADQIGILRSKVAAAITLLHPAADDPDGAVTLLKECAAILEDIEP